MGGIGFGGADEEEESQGGGEVEGVFGAVDADGPADFRGEGDQDNSEEASGRAGGSRESGGASFVDYKERGPEEEKRCCAAWRAWEDAGPEAAR